jgi:hypothetical protein
LIDCFLVCSFFGWVYFLSFCSTICHNGENNNKKKERRDPDSKVQSKGDMENSRSWKTVPPFRTHTVHTEIERERDTHTVCVSTACV